MNDEAMREETPTMERTPGITYETLRDGLLQDLIAVRLLIAQAGPALCADADALRAGLEAATQTLDADIAHVRTVLDGLRAAGQAA